MACLDENTFAAYFDLRLTPAETAALFAHVDTCSSCARLFSETAAVRATQGPSLEVSATLPGGPGAPTPRELPTLGRYQVERILGMGAMAVVYAAHDPELDSKIAITLLQPQ